LFDGAGFLAGARQRGIEVKHRRVLQFGAGGAGSAIAYELAAAGVASLRMVDPNPQKVLQLCAAIQNQFPGFDIAPAHEDSFKSGTTDMVINASTVGMGGAGGLPGMIPPLGPNVVVGEVNVTENGTELIQLAIQAGAVWVDGDHMHQGQIQALLDFFS
jgi:shikimate dehydrogenase